MFSDNKESKRQADEIGKIWQRLIPLEKNKDYVDSKMSELVEITKLPQTSQKEAQSSARSAAQFKGQTRQIKDDAQEKFEQIETFLAQIVQTKSEILDIHSEISGASNTIEIARVEINETKITLSKLMEDFNSSVAELNQVIADNSSLSGELEEVTQNMVSANSSFSKIQSLFKQVASMHSEIKDIFEEINGYEVESEEGEPNQEGKNVIKVEGVKERLEITYVGLSENIKELEKQFEILKDTTESEYSEIQQNSTTSFSEFLAKCKGSFNETHTEITNLLPRALTAGLSAAYDEKKAEEEVSLKNYENSFQRAVIGLVAISLIPFLINVYLFLGLKLELLTIISDTPKLLFSIIPLYFPVLWIAYSSNKKMNLSKRLIEEYTHKGVLSKTFEGLSKQIDGVDEKVVSNELRTQLLFNLLSVNSENPGKLISDYNTSDHPLIDALNKSSKLAIAVEKLANIPGFSKLASNLEKRSKKILKKEDERITSVLSDLDDKDEEEMKS
jgi:hypothetical protein